jgi:uncharacterized protein YbjT (DUF2867 family)
MTDRYLITVLGATGAQGGGLVRAILADPARTFAVRAITRKPDSPVARALAASGAEVTFGDLDDPDTLERAFKGAHGVFGVTNFWEHFSPERELAQAGNIARAAQKAGVRHFIWSTLEDTRQWVPLSDERMPTLMGKYKVPHFDAKGESNRFFTDLGVPTTFLLTSFYWENLIHFGMGPKRATDGKLIFTLPMDEKKLPGIAAQDIGRCAYGIFKEGPQLIGKTIGIAGEHLTGEQMAIALSEVLNQDVRYNTISPEAFRALGFPGAEDLGNMFQFKRDFEAYFCGARNPDVARLLNPSLQSFRSWLEEKKSDLRIE